MEILISEDDFVSRNLLKKMLTAFGHEVIETENGREAWAVLQKAQYSNGHQRLGDAGNGWARTVS